jgi:hypothetical protein
MNFKSANIRWGRSGSAGALILLACWGTPLFGDVFKPVLTQDGANGIQHATVNWRTQAGAGNDDPKQHPIGDSVQPGGTLQFWWTDGTKDANGVLAAIKGYDKFSNTNQTAKPEFYDFKVPLNPKITDWEQTVTYGKKASDVHTGNIQHANPSLTGGAATSPWAFDSLSDLPDAVFMIPDVAPTQDNSGLDTVYTAVNEQLYMQSNPLGFLGGNYKMGDNLGALGISIVDGQIPGIQGLYFATTPFGFDPNSATGFVPIGGPGTWLNTSASAVGGAASATSSSGFEINGIHASVPEPAEYLLLGGGLLALPLLRRRG